MKQRFCPTCGTEIVLDEFSFNTLEIDLVKSFHTALLADNKEEFSSNDFRGYKLDQHFKNPKQQIGMFFAKLVKNGYVKRVGETRSKPDSSNLRRIGKYRFTDDVKNFHFNKHRVKGVQ